MTSIGIRVEPKTIHLALINDDIHTFKINVPLSLGTPQKLKYIRTTVLDILRQYEVQSGGIREQESTTYKPNIDRAQIEAVIVEAFASSSLKNYFYGRLVTMARLNRIPHAQIKDNIAGKMNTLDISGWDEYSEQFRESILCAIGAKNA